jgi:hypothetical protein
VSPIGVRVQGWSVHLPGRPLRVDGFTSPPAGPPERAHELLGRKGLLGKEPSTRMALCAVHRALGYPSGAARPGGPPHRDTGVVVASNLGNVATVHRVAHTVRAGSVRDVSPLDAPNASSNVIASSIAIWYRFAGPNLTVCSGATAGLDAVRLAALLLRAGRADRVVVVGVEPDDEVARALHSGRRAQPREPLRAAAACVVLAAGDDGVVLDDQPAGRPDVVVGSAAVDGTAAVDVAALAGDTYGASGVVNLAVAVALMEAGSARSARVVCGDCVDGVRSLDIVVRRP